MSYDEAVGAIKRQADDYERVLNGWSDDGFRNEIDMFGHKRSRGSLVISLVVSGHAA
jgi:hypothetical protein